MAISRPQINRQLRNMGGRIGLQEGGIMPRLNQLGSGVSSAEQMLQGINQRLESAESNLGGGGGSSLAADVFTSAGVTGGPQVSNLTEIANNLNTFPGNPNRRPIAEPNNIGTLGQPLFDKDGFRLGNQGQGDPLFEPKMSGIPAAGYADGGIASLQDPRQGYFLGKLVKKAAKAVKKVVKSPVGKAAILGALTFGIPGTQFSGLAGGKGLGSFFGKGSFNPLKALITKGPQTGTFGASGLGKLLGKFGLAKGTSLTGLGKIAGITGLSGLAGLMAKGEAEDEGEVDFDKLDRGEGLNILDIVARARKNDPEFRFLPGAEFTDSYAEGGGVGSLAMNEENVKQKFVSDEAGAIPKKGGGVTPGDMGKLKKSDFDSEEDYQRYLRQLNKKAEGGLMNLGGMEMDLRGGGFVPLGAKEKADDVPARLSKNEFVMTADAVRAAGGGSVDKGADKMYNLMKDLESRV